MIGRLSSIAILSVPLFLCASCGTDTDRTVVVAGNQGNFVIKKEPNPLVNEPRPAPRPAGPTTKEVDQQRRIEQLEAQQKALQAEIDRLKREKP